MLKILFLSLLLISCAKAKPEKAIEVYAFGDQLTSGNSYAVNIAAYMDKRIWNQAVDDSTLYMNGQYRSIYNTQFNEGAIVIMLTGYNDAIEFSSEPDYVGRYGSVMKEILNKFEAAKVSSYIGGCIKQGIDQDSDRLCDNLRAELKSIIDSGEYKYAKYVPITDVNSIEQDFLEVMHDP